jgi:uncharacterized protein YbaR (Trm112 family)
MIGMDASLSDLLICPRCGPTYGLILLPYEAADRRVRTGILGCANCRERYPIDGGVADLRPDETGAGAGPAGVAEDADGVRVWQEGGEPAVRLAALMNLAAARGTVLVAGPAAAHAPALAGLVEGAQVVSAGGGRPGPGGPGVSAMRLGNVLPFRSGSLCGVALTGPFAALLEEGARVLGRPGHLVLDPAPAGARERLEALALNVLAEERRIVVAGRSE